ncbi:MAG: DUF87 domain-containing protein, partial [Clostridia bacterium]|nr:DUF87 domain-containing protein [Clostridia bacterium]
MAAKRKSTQAKKQATSSRSKGENTKSAKKPDSYAKRQVTAVVLFAVAVLLICLAIIQGDNPSNFWGILHQTLHGLFGVGVFLVPLLIGYIAIVIAKVAPGESIGRLPLIVCVLYWVVESTLHIFTMNVDGDYFYSIGEAFRVGTELFTYGTVSGGAFGALIGYPMEWAFGDIGARIIICLLLFVFLMLCTRTSLMKLWKPVHKAVDKVRERRALEEEEDEEEIDESKPPVSAKKKRSSIDIELGEGYSDEPASPTPRSKFEKAVQEINEEGDQPPVRVEDLVDQAISDESPSGMTREELHEEEQAVEREIDEAETPPETYSYPPVSLLDPTSTVNDVRARDEMQTNAELLVQTLNEFNISASVVHISRGPSVTRYELQPKAGVKISKITGLADDIALRLAATSVRIEAPIPGKAAIGIELPNQTRATVGLRELIESEELAQQPGRLAVVLGRDITGQIITADLAKMPHLLIAGTTGSGKSVCTNSMIQSILFRSSPEEVRLILIDPKQVEFNVYNGIPHLLVPVVTNPRKAVGTLAWALTEMENRYAIFASNGLRDIDAYNERAAADDTLKPLPLILIVIDELADLMMVAGKDVEECICRLAQMARAAGMHLVIATQRPSVDIITGTIKSNIPCRLALSVASATD